MTSSIIYNDNNISDNEITRVVKRAKVLIENDNKEIAIAYSHNNYFFIKHNTSCYCVFQCGLLNYESGEMINIFKN